MCERFFLNCCGARRFRLAGCPSAITFEAETFVARVRVRGPLFVGEKNMNKQIVRRGLLCVFFFGLGAMPLAPALAEQAVRAKAAVVAQASESIDEVLAREAVHPTMPRGGAPLVPGRTANYAAEKAAANALAAAAGTPPLEATGVHGNLPGDEGDPELLISFQNPGTCGCEPPDPILAVGPSQVLTGINDDVRAFTKSGTLIWSTNWEAFFASVNPAGSGSFTSDPKMFYDPVSQRFFATILMINSAATKSWAMLAVSQSSSITSSTVWTKWAFDPTVAHPSTFADYPSFGFDGSAIYIAWNMFNTAGTAFLGVDMMVIPKAQLIQASPPSSPTFTQLVGITTSDGTSAFTLQPSVMYGGGNCFFASASSGSGSKLYVYQVNNPLASPTLTKASLSVTGYSTPPNAGQRSSSTTVDTGDTRLINAVWRNNKLWTAHTIANGSLAQARWYSVNTASWPAVSMSQAGNVNTGSANYYFPSVSVDQNDDMAMGFTRSIAGTTGEYPSAWHCSRLVTDATGTMGAPVLDHSGTAAYIGTRWGDFSGTTIDPSDNVTFWTMQEFSTSTGDRWSNWVTSFAVASACTSPSVTTGPSPQTTCVNGSASFTVLATGTATLTYQWRRNTVNYGAPSTNPTLTINPVTAGDAGSFDCVVTNSCGSATSSAATLTVNTAAAIASNPADVHACPGSTRQFSVTATGSPAPSYAWRRGTTALTNGGHYSGVNTPTLTISNMSSADVASNYNCLVSNTCGSQASTNAAVIYCAADFDCSGTVEDSDFVVFAAAYDIFICSDPSMPAGCPADLNGDGFVDDTDFVLFANAYDAYFCP